MSKQTNKSAAYLLQACIALDETRYRISCAIQESPNDRTTADACQALNTRLDHELKNLQLLLPAPVHYRRGPQQQTPISSP